MRRQESVPDGWTPTALTSAKDHPEVEWRDLRGVPFTEPFFIDTVLGSNREAVRTPVGALKAAAERGGSLPVVGLIYHTSRCGSTLVSSMLAADPATLVLSEPPPIDEVLRMPGLDPVTRENWLGWMIGALAAGRDESQRRAVIKLDAWASRDLPIFRRVLPDTPWTFLYRDPVEVVASQLRRPGLPALPGGLPPELFGMDIPQAVALGRHGYCAHVFAIVCQDVLEHLDEDGLLIGYDELPDAVAERLLGHFGLEREPDLEARMASVAGRDAKRPELRFDPSQRAPELDGLTRALVTQVAGEAFARVNERARQLAGRR